jgi:hypothetical protein
VNSYLSQVSNLYPFESVSRTDKPFDVCVENIDIGGPTMIRAAAKNHAFVTVVTSPNQFPDLIADMEANGGCTSLALRKRFAAEAFRVTAHYDSMIARWMCEQVPGVSDAPDRVSIPLNREISLKYGCNPHQLPASVYSITGTSLPFEVHSRNSPPDHLSCAFFHLAQLTLPLADYARHTWLHQSSRRSERLVRTRSRMTDAAALQLCSKFLPGASSRSSKLQRASLPQRLSSTSAQPVQQLRSR